MAVLKFTSSNYFLVFQVIIAVQFQDMRLKNKGRDQNDTVSQGFLVLITARQLIKLIVLKR